MKLSPDEIYITEAEFLRAEFDYPFITVDGIQYRQRRALGTGGVVCVLAEEEVTKK